MKPIGLWFALTRTKEVFVGLVLAGLATAVGTGQAADAWKQPVATLAGQIAALLGPGPTALSVRNLSSIPSDQVASIRRSLEESLKVRGVTAGGDESASSVRVTLGENARERLWVAEVTEGNETRVAIAELGPVTRQAATASGVLALNRQALVTADEPVLAVLDGPFGLLVLERDQVVLYGKPGGAWQKQQVSLGMLRPGGRDPHGMLSASADGSGFEAWLPGTHCTGTIPSAEERDALKVNCHESDDPWPIISPANAAHSNLPMNNATTSAEPLRAFNNAARNSFTGVVSPSLGADLPPFYTMTMLPRPAGSAALIDGVDGKVQMVENGALHPIAGTRDWGSDLASLQSACGTGTQVIVSGSGDVATDSLRAYELPLYEATPVSEALELDGSVTDLNASADGRSVLAVVHHADNSYEVDRVTAICN